MTDKEENKCLTEYKKLFCTNCEADCTTSILDCNGYQFFFKGYEQGYEDCRHYAHEYYKPKWHDLKKNPNDLPDTNREVLVLLWDYDDYHIGRYEEEYDDVIRENTYWHFDDFSIDKDKLDIVLGWFELPKVKRR